MIHLRLFYVPTGGLMWVYPMGKDVTAQELPYQGFESSNLLGAIVWALFSIRIVVRRSFCSNASGSPCAIRVCLVVRNLGMH